MSTSDDDLVNTFPVRGGSVITGPQGLVIRAGQVPQKQAMMLRQIQELATWATELGGQRIDDRPDEENLTRTPTGTAELDRLQASIQTQAHAAGIPGSWIERVTRLGQQGIGWHEDHLLPNPIALTQRRSIYRIAHDTQHLTDMAGIAVVREHLAGRLNALPVRDPIIAVQYSRTMHALRMRATHTGRMITISARARERAWGIDQQAITGRVRGLLQLSPAEVDMLWQHYAAPGLAGRLRNSLRDLRHAAPQAGADPEASAPAPEQFLAAARETLDVMLTEQRSPLIGVAITDVLPETDVTRVWEPGTNTTQATDTGSDIASSVHRNLEGGPDP
ncbi:hypothetical protein K7711_19215 [Nocardia sp. CA2R105]|uniref:hypothetical protein n=1 Tax=Nocardia coffeae TaxID=2873381 RepID=UPI001CA5F880|nr:hypothetical protein [Nocardia coffeae]MBY8858617.1 hypothetical protein [Nocardia coffeae]